MDEATLVAPMADGAVVLRANPAIKALAQWACGELALAKSQPNMWPKIKQGGRVQTKYGTKKGLEGLTWHALVPAVMARSSEVASS